MKGSITGIVLAGSVLVLAACGSGSGKSTSGAAQPAAPPAAATLAAAASPAPTVAAQVATPATNPVERVTGTVQSVTGDKVALKEGGSFAINSQTRVTRLVPSKAADLQPGKIVAITAKRQPDDTLLASLVRIFPAAPSATFFGQRPDPDGLMTNATVEKSSGNNFTVMFPGGGAQVTLTPNTQILSFVDATQADIKEGASITGMVRDGVAQTVTVQ